jgi:hypothetical protein
LGLLSAPKHDPSRYPKEGDIANNNNKYAIGNNGDNEPLIDSSDDNNAPIANNKNNEPLVDDVDN